MNVMLSSVGRRNYLVGYFKNAVGKSGMVLGADANENAPALADTDLCVHLPPFLDDNYVPALLATCRAHSVRLLVPLNDIELSLLAPIAAELKDYSGTLVVVAPPNVVETCLDKLETIALLRRLGIRTPLSYTSLAAAANAMQRGEVSFPVVVKPRWGSGSLGLYCAANWRELEVAVAWSSRLIAQSILGAAASQDPKNSVLIQETILGAEYGFDVINDFHGAYVGTLARMKLSMRGGETESAMTVLEPELNAIGLKIGSALRHIGVLDCDAICTESGWVVLDLNPRFGGGYPFSHAAGADVPAAMVAWAKEDRAPASCFHYVAGVVSTKSHCLITNSQRRSSDFSAAHACAVNRDGSMAPGSLMDNHVDH